MIRRLLKNYFSVRGTIFFTAILSLDCTLGISGYAKGYFQSYLVLTPDTEYTEDIGVKWTNVKYLEIDRRFCSKFQKVLQRFNFIRENNKDDKEKHMKSQQTLFFN